MFRYSLNRGFLTSTISTRKKSWDPTLALDLNHPTLVLLEKCRTRNELKQILAQMIRIHLVEKTFPMSRLLFFSATSHPENVDLAILLFNHHTARPNLYMYNTMISALSFSLTKSVSLYKSMLQSYIYPDKHTLHFLLKAARSFPHGKQIHCHAIVSGFSSYNYLQNSLIKMYSEHGQINLAHQVLRQMPQPDAVSFNIMIAGHARIGHNLQAIELFHEMIITGFHPDDFTMVGLLKTCGLLRDKRRGKSIHAWIMRRKSVSGCNLILNNALMDMYVKCEEVEDATRFFNSCTERDIVSSNTLLVGYVKAGDLDIACSLFTKMPNKDLVSWNSLISGFAERGNWAALVSLLKDMIAANIRPDKVTVVSLVCAAAEVGSLYQGRCVHGWVVRADMEVDAFSASALIDMYCKCGSIDRALMVFDKVGEKDVTVWTAMIAGFAYHGFGKSALELFWKMQEKLAPNQVTFIAVLTACSHNGMLDQGLEVFNSMENYGIKPEVEHYGCVVDLLARSGRLSEAKDLIKKMPVKPGGSIWGAMLHFSKTCGNLELAETASAELLKIEPEKEGGYVLLSNLYASCGRWSYSDKIRELMERHGVKKVAGCSSLVVHGVIHEFMAADKRHLRRVEIYSILNILGREMKLDANLSFDMHP